MQYLIEECDNNERKVKVIEENKTIAFIQESYPDSKVVNGVLDELTLDEGLYIIVGEKSIHVVKVTSNYYFSYLNSKEILKKYTFAKRETHSGFKKYITSINSKADILEEELELIKKECVTNDNINHILKKLGLEKYTINRRQILAIVNNIEYICLSQEEIDNLYSLYRKHRKSFTIILDGLVAEMPFSYIYSKLCEKLGYNNMFSVYPLILKPCILKKCDLQWSKILIKV